MRSPAFFNGTPAALLLPGFNLVTDYAADSGATDGAKCTTAGQCRATNSADTCTDGGIFIALRHIAAPTQCERTCKYTYAQSYAFHRLHDGLLRYPTTTMVPVLIQLRRYRIQPLSA